MTHQLHMMHSTREHFIERHDFYVEQVKRRVLTNFADIEGQTDKFADAEFERLKAMPSRGEYDMATLAETAIDNAHGYYALLRDLHRDMLLSALAGCYHQWDKQLRDFLDNELRYSTHADERRKRVWHADINGVLGLLSWFGWDVPASTMFPFLDAARLIVNVYKHGKGKSLTDLSQKYPKYLPDPVPELNLNDEYVDHAWLKISEEEFDEIAQQGIRQFWLQFPELMTAT